MSSALYVFRLFWPFLKELVLGGITLKEGMKTQKKRVFLLFFVSGLIFTIFLIIPKFYQLSQEHGKLEKSVEAANLRRLENRIKELEKSNEKKQGTVASPASAASVPVQPRDPPEEKPLDVVPVKKKTSTRKDASVTPSEKPAEAQKEYSDRKKSYMDFFEQYED